MRRWNAVICLHQDVAAETSEHRLAQRAAQGAPTVPFPITSLAGISEGTIASCLLWIIFFLVLCRTHCIRGAILAISLTALGAVTHESAAVFFIGIAAIAIIRMRGNSAVARLTQFAISAAAIWSACYLISVILHPREPANRADFLDAIFALAFVKQNGRINLAAISTIIACASIFWITRARHKGEEAQPIALTAAISFFSLPAALFLFLPELTVTPETFTSS